MRRGLNTWWQSKDCIFSTCSQFFCSSHYPRIVVVVAILKCKCTIPRIISLLITKISLTSQKVGVPTVSTSVITAVPTLTFIPAWTKLVLLGKDARGKIIEGTHYIYTTACMNNTCFSLHITTNIKWNGYLKTLLDVEVYGRRLSLNSSLQAI